MADSEERRTGELRTFMEDLGVEPYLAPEPIEVRRAAQIGMFAALFAAEPETWPVLMTWLEEHAPAHAAMMRETGTHPETFRAAADILAGVDAALHMLGVCEPPRPGT